MYKNADGNIKQGEIYFKKDVNKKYSVIVIGEGIGYTIAIIDSAHRAAVITKFSFSLSEAKKIALRTFNVMNNIKK